MSKHTPGPWKIHQHREDNNTLGWSIHSVKNGNRVLSFQPDEYGYGNEEEVVANIKLIVAAPALLEALSFCKSVLKTQGLFDLSEKMAFKKAEDAIKLATK